MCEYYIYYNVLRGPDGVPYDYDIKRGEKTDVPYCASLNQIYDQHLPNGYTERQISQVRAIGVNPGLDCVVLDTRSRLENPVVLFFRVTLCG